MSVLFKSLHAASGPGGRLGRLRASGVLFAAGLVVLGVFVMSGIGTAEQTTRLGTLGEGPITASGSALGGQFQSPAGVAVNRGGAGGVDAGSVFMLDSSARRVNQFDSDGSFVRAFGRDVVSDGQSNTGANEQQTVTVNATGGLFKLNVTTGVGAALTTNGSNQITMRTGWGAYRVGDNYTGGNPAGRTITAVNGNVLTVSAASTQTSSTSGFLSTATETVGAAGTGNLDGSANVSNVATSTGAFRVGQAISGAGIPAGTTITAVGSGTLTLSSPAAAGTGVPLNSGIPYNASASTVQSLVEALPGVDPGDIAVSGGPGGTSPYTFTFAGGIYDGNDVANLATVTAGLLTGGASTAAVATPAQGGGYEICRAVSSPADVCQSGSSNNDTTAGALGGLTAGIAVDQGSGRVFVMDQSNRRVSVYAATGEFVGAFGWGVQTGAAALQVCTTATGCVAPAAAGAAAGQFPTQTRGLALSPVDGHVYVASAGNRRVDEFAPVFTGGVLSGVSLVRAFGWNVVSSGPGDNAIVQDERQTITVAGPFDFGCFCSPPITGGTFTVSFDPDGGGGSPAETTAAIPYDASAAVVQQSLVDLSSVAPGDVSVTGGPGPGTPWTVDFAGAYAATDVAQMTANATGLVPAGSTATVATTVPGGNVSVPAREVCVPANGDVCQAGEAGSNPGQFPNTQPTAVAVDDTGAVYAVSTPSCNSTTNVCRVQKYSPDLSSVSDFAPGELTVTSGGGSANRASQLAIDPDDGHVYVAQTVGSNQVKLKEFDPTGALLSVSPPAAPLPSGAATGVALDPPRSRSYVSGDEVFVLGPVPAPGAEMVPPVTEVTEDSAKFTAEVTVPEPGGDGFDTSYRFEYSKNGIDWSNLPANGQSINIGNTPGTQTVTQTATGLDANTGYSVRVRACTSECTTSSPITFTTDGAAPTVALTFTEAVTKTAATLGAQVNPRGSATTYHFEWGTTTAYGNRVPATIERPIGSGSSLILAREHITGLQPATEYHFRIVATNATDTTTGPDQRFETLNDCGLTSGRCFELMSRDQGPVGEAATTSETGVQLQAQGSSDGSKYAYVMAHGNSEATSGSDVLYLTERTPGGWDSRQLSPSVTSPAGGNVRTSTGESSRQAYLSADLGCGFVASSLPLADDAPMEAVEAGVYNLFRQNPDGTYTTITTTSPTNPEIEASAPVAAYSIVGAAQDCERVFFMAPYRYPGVDSTGGTGVGSADNLYEWRDGQLSNAAVIPSLSGPVPAPGTVKNGRSSVAEPGASKFGYLNAVSDDGRQLLFSATSAEGPDAGNRAIFARRDSAVGVNISRSQTATPNQGALYQDASEDGRRVLFMANYGLTGPVENGAATTNDCWDGQSLCDLYLYDRDAPEGDRLTNLTDSTQAGSPNPDGAVVVRGVLDSSDDARVVYFVAQGQLVPGEGNSYAENLEGTDHYNVYRVDTETGDLAFVGLVSRSDFTGGGQGTTVAGLVTSPRAETSEVDRWSSRASSDGRYLAFQSQADVLDNGADDGVLKAYLYDSEVGKTVCVSCRTDLQPSDEEWLRYRPLKGRFRLASNYHNPVQTLSDDGRVLFTSPDVLATGAVQGEDNVYEWFDGQVTLIAHGPLITTQDGARALGITRDGESLFVGTPEIFTFDDPDSRISLYAARMGGGFAAPDSPPAGCDPEVTGSCQGQGLVSIPPLFRTLFPSSGQLEPVERATLSVGAIGRAQRARLASGKRAGLAVRVNRTGVVSVVGSARVAGFRTRVLSARRRVADAGRVVVALRLSKAARRRVARTGVLRVRLVVRFDGVAKDSVRKLVLRKQRPLKNNRRAAR